MSTETVTPETITVPTAPAAPTSTPDTRFTAADIERARQEEKDKVYGRVDDLTAKFQEAQKEIEALRKAREAEVAALEEKQKAAEEAARKKAEDEMSAKELLEKRTQEMQQTMLTFQQEREQERLVFAKEQEFNQLRSYAQNLVQTALSNNEIAPELADYVSGNTREEIDASLALAKSKTDAIVQGIQQAQVQARAAMKGVSATGYSTTGPMDTNSGQQSYSVDDLKNMPMHEYAKIRDKLIPATSQGSNRGLYG
jgi:alanyl-tRNA synthetase